jgi:hypothetical protein
MGPTPRQVARAFAPGLVLIAAGLVVLAVSGGHTAAIAAGILLAGCGGVWVVSAAFYVVGRSEDVERDADERRRSGK